LNFKFKKYWRKTGLNEEWGSLLLNIVSEKKPKNFLEVGVFCGVTSRNVCELLNTIHNGDFSYTGFDLFGEETDQELNEAEPEYIKNQKFSNPLKHIYYNLLLKENLNSTTSIEKFLKKFKNNINLIKGDTNKTLSQADLSKIDFAFIDGGHSYETTYNDLSMLYLSMKSKSNTIVCDDYIDVSHITDVKKAVDDFVKDNNLSLEIIKKKFALIKT
jgi:predicted O-methyltransferase YrrM|tara:strand:+ start:148 stop:795 length:648 start_codon:yes stop_codon:yes gene_type:complete